MIKTLVIVIAGFSEIFIIYVLIYTLIVPLNYSFDLIFYKLQFILDSSKVVTAQ